MPLTKLSNKKKRKKNKMRMILRIWVIKNNQ